MTFCECGRAIVAPGRGSAPYDRPPPYLRVKTHRPDAPIFALLRLLTTSRPSCVCFQDPQVFPGIRKSAVNPDACAIRRCLEVDDLHAREEGLGHVEAPLGTTVQSPDHHAIPGRRPRPPGSDSIHAMARAFDDRVGFHHLSEGMGTGRDGAPSAASKKWFSWLLTWSRTLCSASAGGHVVPGAGAGAPVWRGREPTVRHAEHGVDAPRLALDPDLPGACIAESAAPRLMKSARED